MNHEKRTNIRSFARFCTKPCDSPIFGQALGPKQFPGSICWRLGIFKTPNFYPRTKLQFPVPTKWTHFCRYCLSIARISWDIQLIFRRRMIQLYPKCIPLQPGLVVARSSWFASNLQVDGHQKRIFHQQLLGFPSGIFSWLMDLNGIASGKRSQFAKISIFKFATSTIYTMASSYPLVN